ncbi:MAG: Bax inhibitor-1/YccA family protein [Longicatena sp.]
MNHNENYLEPEYTTTLEKHSLRTFGWLTLGLFITSAVAFLLSVSKLTYVLYDNPFIPVILIFSQLGVCITLGVRVKKMKPTTAKILFIVYSVLTGITFSAIGLLYTNATIALAFLMTTIYFGSLVIIGFTTKMNLLRFGPIIFASLFSLILVEVIMMLMGANTDTMLFSAIGLLIFTALTAYDAQKMKALYTKYEGDETMLRRLSIYSAFDLYLDFINIFLYILQFIGEKD